MPSRGEITQGGPENVQSGLASGEQASPPYRRITNLHFGEFSVGLGLRGLLFRNPA